MILALDIGGTYIKWGIAEGYELIRKGKVPTPKDSFESLNNAIIGILKENSEYEIKGAAISYPGMENPKTGRMVPLGALTYGLNQPVRAMLEESLKLPVSLENDGRLAAIAEAELGSLKDAETGYVLVVGTGIGGAYVRNKKIDSGAHGYAGQASLILIDDIRKSGMNALFTSHTSTLSLVSDAKKALNREDLSGEEFMALVKEGNETAEEVFTAYMDAFTNTLFTLQMLYDPEVFVIGGGISADDLYIRTIQEKYEELYTMLSLDLPHAEIRPAQYRNDANMIGALILYYREHRER